jgi:serine protease Do
MKTSLPPLLFTLCAAAAYSAAAEPAPAPAPGTPETKSFVAKKLISKDEVRETAPVTFLGVDTQPVSRTLTEQLGLPKGVGLVVRTVVPGSAAATTLKPHDILMKLNDQLLIESRQLAVLIRSFKEGDEITLTFYRAGKEMQQKVKLTSREVPKAHAVRVPPPPEDVLMPAPGAIPHPRTLVVDSPGRRATVRIIKEEDGAAAATAVDLDDTRLLFSDDKGSLDVRIKEGRRTLLAKNAKGEEVFNGPIDTEEQRKALPPEIRERLQKMDQFDHLSFEPRPNWEAPVGRPLPYPQLMAHPLEAMEIEAVGAPI